MVQGGILKKAKIALKRRQFSRVITLLEPQVIEYRESFEFFYTLGLACLYLNDIGGANSYFQRARQIKMRDVNLLTAQASLHLRRGNVSQAVECYLDIQDLDASNKIAKKALSFIRKNAEETAMSAFISSGKVSRFYPKLGIPIFSHQIITGAILFLAILCGVVFVPQYYEQQKVAREDLRFLELTAEEKKNSAEVDLTGSIRYILTKNQITDSYSLAQKYFQNFQDNVAQVEVNRILLSNAANGIKEKTRTLADYFRAPTFDTLKDNFSFAQIEKDPYLYKDTYVIWSGRVSNVRENETTYNCDFLIGYDNLKSIDGIIPLILEQPVSIDEKKSLRVLAKIDLLDEKPFLRAKAVFQSVKE